MGVQCVCRCARAGRSLTRSLLRCHVDPTISPVELLSRRSDSRPTAASRPSTSTLHLRPSRQAFGCPVSPPSPLAMVLAELGGKISRALQTMAASSIIDDEVVAKLTSTIAMALLQADVDIRLVKQMQNNIKAACAMDDTSAGANKRKMVQSVSRQLRAQRCDDANESTSIRSAEADRWARRSCAAMWCGARVQVQPHGSRTLMLCPRCHCPVASRAAALTAAVSAALRP